MKLFEFQEDWIQNISKAFRRKNKRLIAQAQCGFGKTVTACEIAIRSTRTNRNVCILVHRVEILNQFYRTFRRFGVTPGIISQGHNTRGGHQIYIGMVETLNRRIAKGILDDLDIHFFIMDEAHWGAYPKILNQIDCHVLGLTATPKSSHMQKELNEMYDDIVVGPSVQDLITLKRLIPARTFSIKHDFSKVKKKGKEFEELSLIREFKEARLYGGAVEKYMDICPDRKAICYCVNIQHGIDTAMQFIEHGKKTYCIDSKGAFSLQNGEMRETNRENVFTSFEKDKDSVLVNVGIATTGYDCPDVSCIIENFATMSITKHHQVIGRGARAHESKEDFIIIDMGRNYVRHKFFGEDIDWGEIFRQPNDQKEVSKRKDVRECDTCGMVIKMRTKVCPYCGEIYTNEDIREKIMAEGTAEEIRQYKLQQLPVYLRKDVSKMSYSEMVQYARLMGMSPRWPNIVYAHRKKKR